MAAVGHTATTTFEPATPAKKKVAAVRSGVFGRFWA